MNTRLLGLVLIVLMLLGAAVGASRGHSASSRPPVEVQRLRAVVKALRAENTQLRLERAGLIDSLNYWHRQYVEQGSQLVAEQNAERQLAELANSLQARLTAADSEGARLLGVVREQDRQLGQLRAELYACQHP
jgi:hypothetical protein